MDFRRSAARLLIASATVLAACGSGSSATPSSPDSSTASTAIEVTATTSTTIAVEQSPSTTEPAPTTTEAPTTDSVVSTVPPTGLSLIADVDRNVAVTSVIVADSDGNLLGTMLDPNGLGCEASPVSFFVTIGADGTVNPTSTTGEPLQYAGLVTPSPNQRQLLEVYNCEGFLGDVTLYDIDPALQLTNPVPIDTRDALAGDAAWNADGFITLMLSDQPGYYSDPLEDGEEPTPPEIDEYLVNPRNGESTQSGSVDEFNYGAIRLADGRTVHVQFGAEPGVIVTSRSGETQRLGATGFAISPDANRMVIWDQIYDLEGAEEGEISLVDLESGDIRTIGEGFGFSALWRDDSTRLAYSVGTETVVLDLLSGETLSVGKMPPAGCDDDDFVRWGRIPLAFAPNGDLYVGDAQCGRSSEGMPTVEYRLRQLTLN